MKESNDQLQGLVGDFFYLRQGERTERCFYSEILYVEASGCYCYIYRRGKPRLSIAYPLSMVEPFLPHEMFRRVHRSYIVNLREVDGFVGRSMRIDNRLIPVSSSCQKEVFGCFVFLELRREKKGGKDEEC